VSGPGCHRGLDRGLVNITRIMGGAREAAVGGLMRLRP
jgi:hypothetical protein